jgi:hypothetical protein
MRRIVTGVDPEGRSYVVSDTELSVDTTVELWTFAPEDVRETIARIAESDAAVVFEPPAGGARWFYSRMPPGAEQRREPPRHAGIDDDGFHTTRTVDFDFIVDGELVMLLDAGTVHLHTGDVVIQQAARHAWRNESDQPATLLALLHAPA